MCTTDETYRGDHGDWLPEHWEDPNEMPRAPQITSNRSSGSSTTGSAYLSVFVYRNDTYSLYFPTCDHTLVIVGGG